MPTALKGHAGSVLPAPRPHLLQPEAGVCLAVPARSLGPAAVRCRHSLWQVSVRPEPLPRARRLSGPPSAGCGLHPAAQSPHLCVLPLSQPWLLRGSPQFGAVIVGQALLHPRAEPCSVPGLSPAPHRHSSAAPACSTQCRGWQRSPQQPSHVPRGCCLAWYDPPRALHQAWGPCPAAPSIPSPPCHHPARPQQ